MDLKNKIYSLFENIDVSLLEDIPKKGIRIGIKFGDNFIGIIVEKSRISFSDSMDKLDNEIITDENSFNEFLEGRKSLVDLLLEGKIYISGKLSNLLKLVNVLSSKSINLGFESGLCKTLKAVFEGICNKNDEIIKQIKNFNASFQFSDFQDNECCLIINEGKFNVLEGRCKVKPNAIISAEKEVWYKIFTGEESVGTIAMNGEAKIEGNLIQAFKLKTIIDKIF
ncbi:hypothetical protein BFU36_12675 [Sulfolobus sp. A20]|uniref:SCP2 sterol-binding domain-containing protein n=1 Tax=Saccharolobus sp. A20 TaxID=1891280 RepID=UPI000845C1A3|nr:SCP2 sterol-binding domain-containing protein [Sulfolobus sp. A20]TRM75321.1 hypothetical protein DJ532_10500 [Sulfolobus sp. A20-N-F8]TRM76147.1 hypothetical protein DJ523_01650 [Sulfolobus sp. E5]TRM81949.1 hypothetical protein DJ524_02325 [Sulfolobus sp. D5]TRM89529.1 hypothetical protein DJ529_01860 [Sulfolobus sp. C3]TRN00128.1 hypothetical protein DJ527_07530 [Sulfolobus sp. F1]